MKKIFAVLLVLAISAFPVELGVKSGIFLLKSSGISYRTPALGGGLFVKKALLSRTSLSLEADYSFNYPNTSKFPLPVRNPKTGLLYETGEVRTGSMFRFSHSLPERINYFRITASLAQGFSSNHLYPLPSFRISYTHWQMVDVATMNLTRLNFGTVLEGQDPTTKEWKKLSGNYFSLGIGLEWLIPLTKHWKLGIEMTMDKPLIGDDFADRYLDYPSYYLGTALKLSYDFTPRVEKVKPRYWQEPSPQTKLLTKVIEKRRKEKISQEQVKPKQAKPTSKPKPPKPVKELQLQLEPKQEESEEPPEEPVIEVISVPSQKPLKSPVQKQAKQTEKEKLAEISVSKPSPEPTPAPASTSTALASTTPAPPTKESITISAEVKKLEKISLRLKEISDSLRELKAIADSLKAQVKEFKKSNTELRGIKDTLRIIKDTLALTSDKLKSLLVIGKQIYLTIHFPPCGYSLDSSAKKQLDQLAAFLIKHPEIRILVEGFASRTSAKGCKNVKDNLELSILRAFSVKNYLVNKNVAHYRIETRGMGDRFPRAPNTKEGRKENRVVIIRSIK